MFSTNLVVLGTYLFISVVSIIIQTGWKFTHKLVPKLPKNKRWSDILISSCQLSVIVFIFYTVNTWFWTDSSEDKSDIWKMSNPVKLLEWKASNASQHFSTTTNILSFEQAVDALPEEAEEYTKLLTALKNFRAPELLGKFYNLMTSNQCDGTMRQNGKHLFDHCRTMKNSQRDLEQYPVWPSVKKFMKTGPTYEAPFANKREQIRQHLESVSESLLNIADMFKKKEQELRNKMMGTTNQKNRELLLWYVLPSMVVFIWTIVSILTTRFNPKVRSSLLVRIILNALFYIVALHVVVVVVFEIVSSSNQCQPDPQLLDFPDFEVPLFKNSSRTITKEDFLNCTAMKSHIFAAPNDEIFIPTTIYDDYLNAIPDTLIIEKLTLAMGELTVAFREAHRLRELVIGLIPSILEHTTQCNPLREFKEILEQVPNMFTLLFESAEPFRYDWSQTIGNIPFQVRNAFEKNVKNEKARFFVNKDFPRMRNAIIASIRNHNILINDAGFDCFSISEAFQHGYNRTCLVINDQLISVVKLVLVGCSVIAIITHILANRKYEIVLEKAKNQQGENQTDV